MTEHQEFLQNSPSALIRLGPNEKRRQTERIYQLEAFDNLTQINTTIRAQLHNLAYIHPECTQRKTWPSGKPGGKHVVSSYSPCLEMSKFLAVN
ncbi:hypothetical protein, partial [Fibrobacter sp. UWH3]|uniref:hypothetical protein n=1 Tax=Fibrobacter sp. UWH3 TaxID=1964353 RepID=UPI000B72E807